MTTKLQDNARLDAMSLADEVYNPGAVTGDFGSYKTNITVPNGGYATESNTTVTLSGTGAGVALNSGAGFNYPNSITGGVTYNNGTTSITQNPWATQSTLTSGKMTLLGDDADLVINGKSLTETLTKLEERLNILNVNEKLESEWAELKELGDKYREMEKYINAKMKTYEALKKYNP